MLLRMFEGKEGGGMWSLFRKKASLIFSFFSWVDQIEVGYHQFGYRGLLPDSILRRNLSGLLFGRLTFMDSFFRFFVVHGLLLSLAVCSLNTMIVEQDIVGNCGVV